MSGKNVAVRWPVRVAARWLARFEAASSIIQMGSLMVTGVSTFLMMLTDYGLQEYAPVIVAATAVAGIIFVKKNAEDGVHNQQKRDLREFGRNFASPNNRIDDEMNARAIIAGMKGRPLTDDEREAIAEEADVAYVDLHDGVEVPGEEP